MLRRRALLQLLGTSSGMALLAACAPGIPSAPVPAPTSAPAKPAAAQARSGGTLRVGIPTDIASLDGHQSSSANSTTIGNMFDRLVSYDVKLQPQPMLAESWDVSPDFKQAKLNVRRGVQFHNGRELTSEDIKWNLQRGRDPKAGTGTYVNQASWFAEMETPDKYTLVVKSEVSRPFMFDYFNALNIIDPAANAKTEPIGTGPFAFGEWVQGDHLTMNRNKNYWQSGRPYVDTYTARVSRDVVAMTARLEANELDAVNSPSLDDFVRLRADGRYKGWLPPGQNSALAMGATTVMPPTDNKLVRQAINYALDRKRYAEQGLQSIVPPLSLPWDKSSPAYEAAKEQFYTFDLDKARALVDRAGANGAELDFLASATNPEFALIGQILQADLAKIGLKLNIVRLEQAAWLDQVNNRKYRGMWASTMSVPVGDPITAFSNGRGTDPRSNNEGYSNERYATLIATGAAEPDPAKRKPIYSELNDILLEDSFVMVIAPYPNRLLTSAKVRDVITPTSEPTNFSFTNVWLDTV